MQDESTRPRNRSDRRNRVDRVLDLFDELAAAVQQARDRARARRPAGTIRIKEKRD